MAVEGLDPECEVDGKTEGENRGVVRGKFDFEYLQRLEKESGKRTKEEEEKEQGHSCCYCFLVLMLGCFQSQ